jgi:hypothetical protein
MPKKNSTPPVTAPVPAPAPGNIPAAQGTPIKVFKRTSAREVQALMAAMPEEFGKDDLAQVPGKVETVAITAAEAAGVTEADMTDLASFLAAGGGDTGNGEGDGADADEGDGEGDGDGDGEGDGEGDSDSESESESEGQGEGQGEGEGESEQDGDDRPAFMSDLGKLEQKLTKGLSKFAQQKQKETVKQVQEAATQTVKQVKDAVAQTAKQLDEVTKKLEAAEAAKHITIHYAGVDKPDLILDGDTFHPLMIDGVRRTEARIDWAMCGPTGCGKTHLAMAVAKACGLRLGSISWTEGVSESVILGRRMPDAGGVFIFQSTQFLDIYENGGLWLDDEFDGASANVTLTLNSAQANGFLPVPNRIENPVARRHKDFVRVVAMNTYGNGADRMYVGRNQLDAAVLDRFACNVLDMDYDEALERKLVSQPVCHLFHHARKLARQAKLRRSISTRAMLHADKLLSIGYTLPEVWTRFVAGWTPEEITKVTAGLTIGA